ncbi:hypothetical protein JG687_00018005 [Phytophthora cactorum]|uniref:Uncharacterized protein n=1 Tax=Phytophthora cactorum TaxID=29920 RepID=A0A8T1TNV8_9STRA|nr:hypothetical protein JG687_00018005 [Phytophthora cactorum]
MSTNDLINLQTQAGISTAKVHATMLLIVANYTVIPKDISSSKSTARSELLARKMRNEALFEVVHARPKTFLGLGENIALDMPTVQQLVRGGKLVPENYDEHWWLPAARSLVSAIVDDPVI